MKSRAAASFLRRRTRAPRFRQPAVPPLKIQGEKLLLAKRRTKPTQARGEGNDLSSSAGSRSRSHRVKRVKRVKTAHRVKALERRALAGSVANELAKEVRQTGKAIKPVIFRRTLRRLLCAKRFLGTKRFFWMRRGGELFLPRGGVPLFI